MVRPYVWVCPACGKHSDKLYNLGDSSCILHAVPCKRDSLEMSSKRPWAVAKAEAYDEKTREELRALEREER